MPGTIPLRRLVVPLLAAPLVGCGAGAPKIAVTDAFVPVPATADASVYLKISNSGDADDRLLKVTTSKAAGAMLHQTEIDADGRASMKGIGTLRIPAGKTVELSPGGFHLMMMQPQPLADGDTVDLTLTFQTSGTKRVTAEVTDDIGDVIGS